MAIIDKLSKYIRVELLEIVFYIVFVITVTGLIPLAVGLSGRAFSESFKAVNPLKLSDYLGQYVVYYILDFVCNYKLRIVLIENNDLYNPLILRLAFLVL